MKDELFEELLASVQEAGAIRRGLKQPSRAFTFDDPDVRAIRESFSMSQAEFADFIGISKRTLEGWEQGRRKPDGTARRLLEVAAKFPEAVKSTLYSRTYYVAASPEPATLVADVNLASHRLVPTHEWESMVATFQGNQAAHVHGKPIAIKVISNAKPE